MKCEQVGRVCFHLAENKKNPDYPFAFLATYSTGIGEEGRLKALPLKQALKQYCGSNDKQALIKLLTHIHNASQKCAWVQDLVSTAELYQPLAWTVSKGHQFLSSIPYLEESGLQVRIPNWWKQRSRPQVKVTIGTSTTSSLGIQSLLNFNIQIALGDENLSELDFLQGGMSNHVMEIVSDHKEGPFPNPTEIEYSCDCPDWGRHVQTCCRSIIWSR